MTCGFGGFVLYLTRRCYGPGAYGPSFCVKDPHYTRRVHPTNLQIGETYEFDACGATGVNVAACGWREITQQNKVH